MGVQWQQTVDITGYHGDINGKNHSHFMDYEIGGAVTDKNEKVKKF